MNGEDFLLFNKDGFLKSLAKELNNELKKYFGKYIAVEHVDALEETIIIKYEFESSILIVLFFSFETMENFRIKCIIDFDRERKECFFNYLMNQEFDNIAKELASNIKRGIQ